MASDQWLALHGKVVVVAGAGGGGIGTSVCAMVARAGGSVLALDNRPEALDAVDIVVRSVAGQHRSVVTDVCDLSAVEEAVDGAADLGPLFGLVHVAGGTRPQDWSSTHRYDLDVFDEVFGAQPPLRIDHQPGGGEPAAPSGDGWEHREHFVLGRAHRHALRGVLRGSESWRARPHPDGGN